MLFFRFHNPYPLVDGELELVAPSMKYVDEALASAAHPAVQAEDPTTPETARLRLLEFLEKAPGGFQSAATGYAGVPAYHFWMLDHSRSDYPIVGGLGLRIGGTRELEFYTGHIGYHVHAFARGRRFAERACRLVLPVAGRHRMKQLWITCNPENLASRKTIERAGGKYVDTVELPPTHPFRTKGESHKCRFVVKV